MNYADYKELDVLNGTGIRYSLFVSGCSHHCEGCFNKKAWDYKYGTLFTNNMENKIIKNLNNTKINIQGISFLGGEPFENLDGLIPLALRVKKECKNKDIWIWSGYTYEQIIQDKVKLELLKLCDVLVDGKFIKEKKDLKLKFRGSSNQRIINVQKSLKQNKVILWEDNY
ncbi:TPA: anaerobic ribonucleoside-triphosphate reductase activating protein [Clostridium botulinum]|nr:anaerobic ribonucleoside-triphosphate reductase activating protein [Clostridium botulinum]